MCSFVLVYEYSSRTVCKIILVLLNCIHIVFVYSYIVFINPILESIISFDFLWGKLHPQSLDITSRIVKGIFKLISFKSFNNNRISISTTVLF